MIGETAKGREGEREKTIRIPSLEG